jgi:hypothetical protein
MQKKNLLMDGLIQGREKAPLAEEGCAGTAGCSGRWAHSREFSADYTITMSGFDFRQGQPA